MTNKPIHTVEDILAGTIKNGFDGSIQTAGKFIFGDSDATLPYSQKRAFLTAVEGMRYRDNRGQDHLRPTFTLIETGVEPALAEEVRSQLLALCETGLLSLISESPHRFAFTDAGFVFIANYFTLREFHEGGGRAKLPPDLSYRTVILPSIQTSAKSFVQLLKSIQRRRFEAETGTLMQFQDKDAHDYESITRIAYSLQTPTFFIDPAISFEVIPLEQSRVKVVAQCYHVLAEDSFDFALREISETWPEATPTQIAELQHWRDALEADKALSNEDAAVIVTVDVTADNHLRLATIAHKYSQRGKGKVMPESIELWERIAELKKIPLTDSRICDRIAGLSPRNLRYHKERMKKIGYWHDHGLPD